MLPVAGSEIFKKAFDLADKVERGERKLELPDDSGNRTYKLDLPDDTGDARENTCLSTYKERIDRTPSEVGDNEKSDIQNDSEDDDPEKNLEELVDEYFNDLKEKSDCPDTIPDRPFEIPDLEKTSPEENREKREEFQNDKGALKKQWEEQNGMEWPKYDHDVYSASGKLIRKAGSDYDAHHIQPLGMGGENSASNITPLSAEVHYDKQGVHSPDSPYSQINKRLGGDES
jgi:hypothetical protein